MAITFIIRIFIGSPPYSFLSFWKTGSDVRENLGIKYDNLENNCLDLPYQSGCVLAFSKAIISCK